MGTPITKISHPIYVTGTGCCGFQASFQVLYPIADIIFKSSPIKYQNSFQLNLSKINFIRNRQYLKKFSNGNYIHPKVLDYADKLITINPQTIIICLQGDKEKTIKDLQISYGFQNPFTQKKIQLGVGSSRYDLYDFKQYISSSDNQEKSYENYYERFYSKARVLASQYPRNFFIVDSGLNKNIENEILRILNLKHYERLSDKKYGVKKKIVTTALNGGLGNNLFQIAEAFVVAKNFNYGKVSFGNLEFSPDSYKHVPVGYSFDKFLGGHSGSVKDLNETFSNLNFQEKIEVNPDTLFISTDMFNFNRVGNFTEIRHLLKVDYQFKPNSLALHLRFGGLLADHHKAERIHHSRYIKILNKLSDVSSVFVYSDNNSKAIEFVSILKRDCPQTFEIISGNLFQTIKIAMGCEYQLMHSSTLSYWVAFLSSSYNSDKIYLPREFFKKHHKNMIPGFPWQIF